MLDDVQGGSAAQTDAGASGSEGGQDASNHVIDWNTVDLKSVPETLIKQHPAFKQVLSESVERRQKIKELREQIEQLDSEKPVKTTQTASDAASQNPGDVMAQLAALNQKIADIEKNNHEGIKRVLIGEAMKKHNLPSGADAFIQGNTAAEIEASAAALVALVGTQGAGAGNAGGNGPVAMDNLRARINERVRGKLDPISKQSPFDPGVQRQKGGGGLEPISKGSKGD